MKNIFLILQFLFVCSASKAQTQTEQDDNYCVFLNNTKDQLLGFYKMQKQEVTIKSDGSLYLDVVNGGSFDITFDEYNICKMVSIVVYGKNTNEILLKAVNGCKQEENTDAMITWKCETDCYVVFTKQFQPIGGLMILITKK